MAGPDGRSDSALGFSILGRRFEARGVPPAMVEWLRSAWHFPEHDSHAPASDDGILLYMADVPPDDVRHDRGGSDDMKPSVSDALAIIAPGWRGADDVWETGTRAAGVRLTFAPRGARIHAWAVNGE